MEIKEMNCTLTVTNSATREVNTLNYKGVKAIIELAKAYKQLNKGTRSRLVRRATRTGNPYANETKITIYYHAQSYGTYTYEFKFNFNDEREL